MLRLRRLALVALAVASAGLVACGQPGEEAQADGQSADGWHGRVLEEPWAKPEFTLTDTDGQPYDFAAETDGHLTLLFFGYTHCPDVCPLHMANLSEVLDQLPGSVRVATKVVFVTTDPARDTSARLKEWLGAFDAAFVGLTGTQAEVAAAQEAAGVPVAGAEPPDEDGNYAVGHAAQVIAYTRDDQAHIVYPFGTRQDDWAADLPRLLEEAAWNP
jgi:protein SCO1/2